MMELVLWITGLMLMVLGTVALINGAVAFGLLIVAVGIYTFYEAIILEDRKES
jgi:hypothetical protein